MRPFYFSGCIGCCFPVGWMDEEGGLAVGLEVKVINQFETSTELVQVPLKFLPVKVFWLRNKSKPLFQEFPLGVEGVKRVARLKLFDVEFHPRSCAVGVCQYESVLL